MKKKSMEVAISSEQRMNTPWHLWLMGLFFIYIYANGIYDFFMMLGHNVGYYNSKHYGEAVVVYFTDYPLVFLTLWTLNVFCGLIASILLLLHTRWAVWVAFVSAVSMLSLEVLTFALRNRWNVFGPWLSLFDIVLLLMTFGFFFYSRALLKRGILR